MHEFQREFLVDASKSDKINHHGYHRIYPWFLKHFKDGDIRLLEIGVHETESMRLWPAYFKKVFVHGLDIDEKKFDGPNVKIHQVDQSSEDQLKEFARGIGEQFDIMIDDGSHVPSHQILTLETLWGLLAPGGVYIVEDIETSYWGKSHIYGYEFNANRAEANFISYAMKAVDAVNSEFCGSDTFTRQPSKVYEEVEMVTFAHNCVIIVKKDVGSFSEYYGRDYHLSRKINSLSLYSRTVNFVRQLFGQSAS